METECIHKPDSSKPLEDLTFDEVIAELVTVVSENGPLLLSPGMSMEAGNRAILSCLRELQKRNARLELKDVTVHKHCEQSLWLQRHDGEGMQLRIDDKWWKENM